MYHIPIFEDTKKLDAHIYLDYMGHETKRAELITEHDDGWVIIMAYVGGGFCPLSVAIGTTSTNPSNPDYSSACGAMQEYFMRERPDELDDDLDLPEELVLQVYPGGLDALQE